MSVTLRRNRLVKSERNGVRALALGLGLVGCLAASGFASRANAAATIDLIWAASGTTNTTIGVSTAAILRVVLTNDVASLGASVSVDYSDASDQVSVNVFTNFTVDPSVLPLQLFPLAHSGTTVGSFNATALVPYVGGGLPAGQSYLIGTITFHKFADGVTRTITPFLGPLDGVSSSLGAGVLPNSQITFASATIRGFSTCGNSVVEGDEDCDDGNTSSGDCCSDICEFETSGSSCDDSDVCTNLDICDGSGSCDPGPPIDCDDGQICTADSCDPITGCQNEPILECTVPDVPSGSVGTRVSIALVILGMTALLLHLRWRVLG